jgi:hypothetical protein
VRSELTRAAGCAALLLIVATSACLSPSPGRDPDDALAVGKPRVDLAGRAEALVLQPQADLVPGPGADGRYGDFLLQNAFVRFVVASADHADGLLLAGNLIDAAVQGCEDRMRCLVPLVGSEVRSWPVYTTVRVENPGGDGVPCAVTASGRLCGRQGVYVTTTYSLAPDRHYLQVETEVANDTAATLPLLRLEDALYHGRTLRSAPGTGLFPAGRVGAARWLSLFWQGLAWGLVVGGPDPAEMQHAAGFSVVRYATLDIPAGESRRYTRRFLALTGGPEAVWREAQPFVAADLARLTVSLVAPEADLPGPAGLMVEPVGDGAAFPLLTGADGRVSIDVPQGSYRVTALAPGRPAVRPISIGVVPPRRHSFTLPVSPLSQVSVPVRVLGPGTHPGTPASVQARPAFRGDALAGSGPSFPLSPWGLVSWGSAEQPASIRPLPLARPATYSLLVSRGTLYGSVRVRLPALAGRPVVPAALRRVIDPGDYVSVDFRQHTEASFDCALTVAERRTLNAAHGLDVGIALDHTSACAAGGQPPGEASQLVPGVRLDLPGVISLGVIAAGLGPDRWETLGPAVRECDSAADALNTARQLCPGGLTQLVKLWDEQCGAFALGADLSAAPFDCLEVLSGDDVTAARRSLDGWFRMLNGGSRAFITAGSGSTGLTDPLPGVARTFVRCPGWQQGGDSQALADAIESLRETPDAFVSTGPFVQATLNGKRIGSVQTVASGTVRLTLRVSAAHGVDVRWGRVYRNGDLVEAFDIPPGATSLRCERVLDLPVTGDCWFVVTVGGGEPTPARATGAGVPSPWAATNPFWVDVDGDGLVRVARATGT